MFCKKKKWKDTWIRLFRCSRLHRRKRKHESREDNPELRGRGEQDGLEEILIIVLSNSAFYGE